MNDNQLPSGWWILPAAFLGGLVWGLLAVWALLEIAQ